MTLATLPTGAIGVLGNPSALSPTVLRLIEMGLTSGARVVMTRRAPLGDPIEVQVRGTRLCLRAADALCFPIEPMSAETDR